VHGIKMSSQGRYRGKIQVVVGALELGYYLNATRQTFQVGYQLIKGGKLRAIGS
jgi:hypothetical protein